MTHKVVITHHFSFRTHRFEPPNFAVCVWCKQTRPLPPGTFQPYETYSPTFAPSIDKFQPEDCTQYEVKFDEAKFCRDNPDFVAWINSPCGVYDEEDMVGGT